MDLLTIFFFSLLSCIIIVGITIFIIKRYFANKIIDSILKTSFDNDNIDSSIVNLTSMFNDMNNDSQDSNDSQSPQSF